jgi:adenylate kinase
MGASEELEYLKGLVSKLNEKIASLEAKAKGPATPSPAAQLRTILIGPPGAGMFNVQTWEGLWS